MRSLRAAAALVLLAGCAPAPRPTAESDCTISRTGDPLTAGFLDGSWQLELAVTSRELRYQPPSAPLPPVNAVHGMMTFDVRGVGARRDSALAPDARFGGVVRAPLDSLLARTPPGWAHGAVPFVHHAMGTPEGAFALRLGADTCVDCGHVILRGTRHGDRVCGLWRQAFLGVGDRGTFILRRRGAAPPSRPHGDGR